MEGVSGLGGLNPNTKATVLREMLVERFHGK